MILESLPDDSSVPDSAQQTWQILALSGGGFRGLYTATILEKLQAHFSDKPFCEHFDLIAGTSIGGILALALAADVPVSHIRSAFEKNAASIFPKKNPIAGIFKAKYSQDGLRNTIAAILGDAAHASLSSLKTDVLISSVDVTHRGPKIFSSSDASSTASLLDIALATSAAPTYFPEHTVDDNIRVDGGLIANAPDMLALLHSLRLQPLDDIRMLSIGTAGREGAKAYRLADDPGKLEAAKLFFLTLDAQEQCSVDAVRTLLADRYLRLDDLPSEDQRKVIGLDVTTPEAIKTLSMMGAETSNLAIQQHAQLLRGWFNHNCQA